MNTASKATESAHDTSRIVTVDRLSGASTVRVVSYKSVIHPLYRKRYTQTDRMLVDTGSVDAAIGDTVRIVEARPISKHKSWKIIEIIKKAPQENLT